MGSFCHRRVEWGCGCSARVHVDTLQSIVIEGAISELAECAAVAKCNERCAAVSDIPYDSE
jgi:hypothetical protein